MNRYVILLALGGLLVFIFSIIATAIALNVRIPGFVEPTLEEVKAPKPPSTTRLPRPRQANGAAFAQQPGGRAPVSRLEFASSTSPNLIPEAKAVAQLYVDDIAKARAFAQTQGLSGVRELSVQLATVDLDADGFLEVVVHNNLPDVCTGFSCPFDIYKQSPRGGFNTIFSTEALMISILATETDRYIDILVSIPLANDATKEDKYVWTGTTYEFDSSLWDPSADKP